MARALLPASSPFQARRETDHGSTIQFRDWHRARSRDWRCLRRGSAQLGHGCCPRGCARREPRCGPATQKNRSLAVWTDGRSIWRGWPRLALDSALADHNNRKGIAYGNSEQVQALGSQHRDRNCDRHTGRDSLQSLRCLAHRRNLRRHRSRSGGRAQEMSRLRGQRAASYEL